MKRIMRPLCGLFAVSLIIACMTTCEDSGTDPEDQTYSFLAGGSIGDLLKYTVDFNTMEYEYRVLESSFGLTDATGAGDITLGFARQIAHVDRVAATATADHGCILQQTGHRITVQSGRHHQ